MSFAVHMPRPGDLFSDVGANIGAYTILANAVSGARGIAFERCRAHMIGSPKRSIEWIGRESRRATRGGWRRDWDGTDPSNLDTANHVLPNNSISDATASEQVEVTTLDAIFSEEAPTVIKIDVEGFEMAVLDGGARTLADPRLRAVIAELNSSGET